MFLQYLKDCKNTRFLYGGFTGGVVVDCLGQINGLASGHKCSRFSVHCRDAARTVKTVERQRKGREVLVIQMHRQRNFLLSGGCFIREAGCSNRAECRFEIIDIEFFVIICPSSLRILIILVLRRMIGEGIMKPPVSL